MGYVKENEAINEFIALTDFTQADPLFPFASNKKMPQLLIEALFK